MFLAIALCALTVADSPKEKPFKPTMVFSGSHSQIKKERFVQVLATDAWKKLWEEHRGKDPKYSESHQEFEIDFDTHYVIAIFTGRCDWCSINSRLRGEVLHIGYEAGVNQTEGGPLGSGDKKLTPEESERAKKYAAQAPYAFVVLPKPIRAVVIELDVRSVIADPPVWKPRTRFSAPSDK